MNNFMVNETNFNSQDIQQQAQGDDKEGWKDFYRSIRDTMLEENPFTPYPEVYGRLREQNQRDGNNLETEDLSTLAKEVTYKQGLVQPEDTEEYLTHKASVFQDFDHEEIKQRLRHFNNNHCVVRVSDDALERILASSSASPKCNDDDDEKLPEVKMFSDLTPTRGKRPFIIDGVVFKGHAAALYGDGGSAKSTCAMHMGQCVARGVKWLGFDTVKTKVLYLDFELDQEEQTRRAYEIAAGDGYAKPPTGFYYLPGAGYPTRDVFDHALRVCQELGIGVVIVDSLGYALGGDAEASRDVLEFFRQVEGSFRRAGITLVIVDHQAKTRAGSNYRDMTMFGSVYKSNSVRSVFQVEPNTHDEGYIDLIVRHQKVNFGPKLNPFGVEVKFDTDKTTLKARELEASELVDEKLNASDKVLLALNEGPQYPDELAQATGLQEGTVKNALTALRKAGKVEDTGEKRGKAHEVRKVSSSSSLHLGDGDSDANDWLAGVGLCP